MLLLILLGAFVVIALANAYRLDRKAAARGLKYVPVKQNGWLRSRTRMVLVERGTAEAAVAERLYEEQQAERAARAEYDPWRRIPGSRRRRR